ncbi:MAG: hypothetical protein GY716_25105 [bacterium]|nr:hypothetical protein [bacterium]
MTGGALPPGFEKRAVPGGTLYAAAADLDALARLELDSVEGWRRRLSAGEGEIGRGRSARVECGDGRAWRLKQLLRGGAAARLWRNRFPGANRLLDNLRIPHVARDRGVRTPAAAALFLVPGPPGLWRAWLAVEELAGAADLASMLRANDPPTPDDLALVMREVRRMHDAGIEHRDLNLGNLMLRRVPPEAHVIDLDRAAAHDRSLPLEPRRRALRRLERSYAKITGDIDDAPRRAFYEHYAAGDADLLALLLKGRSASALRVRRHERPD